MASGYSFMITCDSRNRILGDNADFSTFFNNSYLEGDSDYLLGLYEAIITNLIYPIRTGRNQVVFYENNNIKTTFTATIPTGN
jgi:pectin methylesterase-like acyl-CoA thioesterase